jgi:SAM-dependent methyltransferase
MSTLERITPRDLTDGEATGADTLVIHLARYDFASHYIRPGRLLDVACGVGYGTHLLASRRDDIKCVGADIASDAIATARNIYSHPRAEFVVADAMNFSDPDGFGTIVSLETIEHLPEPQAFVDRLVTLLRPGGRLIASVPSTPSVDANPHHMHDFTEDSFRALFRPHRLDEIACLRIAQPYAPVPVLRREEARAVDIRRNLLSYYASNPRRLVRRLAATLRYGFENRYLTVAFEKPA